MEITLHPKQSLVHMDNHRFQVVAAGRRFGKSFFAAVRLYEEAAQTTKIRSDGTEIDLINEIVYYVSPTFKQGRENLWNVMMELGRGLIKNVRQNEGEIQLTNNRIIRFKGADDPDSLRGVGLGYAVMDEYAFMKPSVWEYIIRPALGRAEGGALFIGTPAGKNHFFSMWAAADEGVDPSSGKPTTEWKAFQFRSSDNPHLTENEIEAFSASMSKEAQAQELEASFEAAGGKVFTFDMFPVVKGEHLVGEYVVPIDLAGFSPVEGKNKPKHVVDDHAIAVVKVHDKGWHVERIIHGRWDVRETALRVVKAWRDYRPLKLGIEKGIAKNAVEGFIEELMHKYGYFSIEPLSHSNNKKEDRIKWALQGRAEKRQITLEPDVGLPEEEKWIGKFLQQAVDFPNPLAHDDLLDAVAYADQLGDVTMGWESDVFDDWKPLDLEAGY